MSVVENRAPLSDPLPLEPRSRTVACAAAAKPTADAQVNRRIKVLCDLLLIFSRSIISRILIIESQCRQIFSCRGKLLTRRAVSATRKKSFYRGTIYRNVLSGVKYLETWHSSSEARAASREQ